MLSKEVFKRELERLLAFYPLWRVNEKSPVVMKAWYDFMNELGATDKTLEFSVTKHINEISFNPTITSLVECGLEVKNSLKH